MSETPMKKLALLIGINEYQILPGLKYARQDAEAVADSLKQNYCFSDKEVLVLTDARTGLLKPTNRYIIQEHLEKLANQEFDLLIFGFWGHGLYRNGKRYLCPQDVMSSRVEQQGFPFDELQDLLARIKAKNTCIILDCCQRTHDRGEAETLTVSDQVSMGNAARDIVYSRKENSPDFHSNVAILNSCKEGQSAYEWDTRQHGLFTAYLLDAMKNRYNSVMRIASYISSNIEKTALELGKEQTPFFKLEGDIILPVATSPIPQPPVNASPERSKDSVLQNPVFDNNNATIKPTQIEQRQSIQYTNLCSASRSSFEWNGTTITKFIGQETEVVIPEGVTEIGDWAFSNCSSITFVSIPKGVVKIGIRAFDGCRSLTSVTVPDSVKEICRGAFAGCTSLKAWSISPAHPFFQCDGVGLLTKDGKKLVSCLASAKEYRIPEGVTTIEWAAFDGCSFLTSVSIPKSVKEIGWYAFDGCRSLTSVTIPEGVTVIKWSAFSGCSSLTSVTIPEGVTEIWSRAFSDCRSLKSVIIPKGVTVIGDYSFSGCSCLTSVAIPEGVTEIGDYAFSGCSRLTSATIPEGVTEIGDNAFSGCYSLMSVTIPDGVTKIGDNAFSGCKSLVSVTIPKSVTTIGNGAFEDYTVIRYSGSWWHDLLHWFRK